MPRGVPRQSTWNDRSINLTAARAAYAPTDLADDIDVSEETRLKWAGHAINLRPVHAGSWNDPITVMLVLDTVLATEQHTIIRSVRLTPMLALTYEYVHFAKQTVGRILNEISEVVATCPVLSDEDIPLRLSRDYAGLLWEWNPTLAGLAALYQMREYIDVLALLQSKDVDYALHRTPTVWENFEWSDIPVR